MIYVGKELEKIYDINNLRQKNGENIRQVRLFNILPLRTNVIPKHITLDTSGLIQNFIDNEPSQLLI